MMILFHQSKKSFSLCLQGPRFRQTNIQKGSKKSSSVVGKKTKRLQATKSEQNLMATEHQPNMMRSSSEWILSPPIGQSVLAQSQRGGRIHPSPSLPDYLNQATSIQYSTTPSSHTNHQHYYSSPMAGPVHAGQRLASIQRGGFECFIKSFKIMTTRPQDLEMGPDPSILLTHSK